MCRRRIQITNKQLKNLKDTLWTTADQLRATSGLKSTEYAEPILGLIFLRFTDVEYSKLKSEIKAEFDSIKGGTRMERPVHEIAIEKCSFYLPEEARYDWLLNLHWPKARAANPFSHRQVLYLSMQDQPIQISRLIRLF